MATNSDGVVRVGERLVRRVRSAIDPQTTLRSDEQRPDTWLAVTVLRDASEVDPLPAPLAELGDEVEVRVGPAPGGKGVELRARRRDRTATGGPAARLSGTDGLGELRSALRRAKQLLEVGEVLRVDPTPHGQRPSTPGGVLLESWTRGAPSGGVR